MCVCVCPETTTLDKSTHSTAVNVAQFGRDRVLSLKRKYADTDASTSREYKTGIHIAHTMCALAQN